MKTEIKISIISVEDQPSAQIVGSIDDLLTEIFLRLPTKSLIRFKSVSEHWRSLISDPGFCILRNPGPNPAVGLFMNDGLGSNPLNAYVPFSRTKSTNPPFGKSKFTNNTIADVLQSCNGLFLCRSFRAIYSVWNPTTNQSLMLPKLDGVGGMIMSLAFDPAKSPHYEVVCVHKLGLDSWEYQRQCQFEVYSSESRRWRKCGEPFVESFNFKNGVYWNGAIHWIDIPWNRNSLYFNVDDQMLRVMPMPPIPNSCGGSSKYYFGESCDHLHYIVIIRPQVQFNVYEMRRDYSEWFANYRVDLSPVVAAYPGMARTPREWGFLVHIYDIFSLVRGEKEEDSFLVLQIPGRVIRYNIVYETFETIYEFADGDGVKGSLRFPGNIGFQYIESLGCV